MKRMNMTIAAILVLTALAVGISYAGSASEAEYGSQSQNAMMGQSQDMLKANDILGKTVNDQQGQEIGTVNDLVIGDQGRVEYVILSPTGDLARDDQLIPLPWQIIQAQSGQEALTAAVEMQRLQNAPSISEDQVQQLANQDMQTRVRGYYGVEESQGQQMMRQDHMMRQDDMMQQHDGMMQQRGK